MNRRFAWALGGVALALVVVAMLVLRPKDVRPPVAQEAEAIGELSGVLPADVPTDLFRLFFPGLEGELVPEMRELPIRDDPRAMARSIMTGLIAGPASDELRAPLPLEVEVGGIDISIDGVLYLDLRSATYDSPPVTGSRDEMLSLFSLVHSLVENLEAASSVVILWNGRQPSTFGGHIDTSHPVVPLPSLVAS